jgi:hypothetical protein
VTIAHTMSGSLAIEIRHELCTANRMQSRLGDRLCFVLELAFGRTEREPQLGNDANMRCA